MSTVAIADQDKDFLVTMLTEKSIDEGDHRAFFRNIGLEANLPKDWYSSYFSQIKDSPRFTAQNVVKWALGMEWNTKDGNFTTLGSILRPLIKDVGLETAQRLVVI